MGAMMLFAFQRQPHRGRLVVVSDSCTKAPRRRARQHVTCQQNYGCLDPFAREDFLVVSGSVWEIREQPENAIRGAWLGKVAPDPPHKPLRSFRHQPIMRVVRASGRSTAHPYDPSQEDLCSQA